LKISIERISGDAEEEIIIRCREVNDEALALMSRLKTPKAALIGYDGDVISHIKPSISGRFEAVMENGETVVVSRQYAPVLKSMLGL